MLRTLFLMETEIICQLKRGLNLRSWVTKWNFLTFGLVSFSSKFMFSDWNWRTPISDMWNLEESKLEQVEGQLNVIWKGLRSPFRLDVIHEMGPNWRRAQELRVDDFSETKIERPVMWYDAEALFTDTRVAREGAWMIPENFRRFESIFSSSRPHVQIFFVHLVRDHIWRPNWDQHETTLWNNLWFANFYSVRAVLASGNFKAPPSSLVVC